MNNGNSNIFAGDITNSTKDGNCIRFTLSNGLLNVYVIEPHIIRFRYTQEAQFSSAPSYAVIYSPRKRTPFTILEKPDSYEIDTALLNVHITRCPCRVAIFDREHNLINNDEPAFGVSFDCDEVRCYKKLHKDEQFLGLAEKTGPLTRRGQFYTMWNSDFPSYSKKHDPLYVSIPFLIGLRDKGAYGIFFDNTYRSYFNTGASNDRFYWFGADKGEMDYYFIYGPAIKRVISSYTMLTGRMEIPPLWALGFQQSKWSYFPESKVREIAANFRKYRIPCDVIYLDIDYMDGYRVFTWDRSRFPDPEKMISDLAKEGFKIITIIDPGVKADDHYFAAKEGIKKDLFVKYPDGMLYKGEVWPSWAYFPDFTKEKTRQWWGEKLSTLLAMGVEGFWNDMNEPAVWGGNFPDIVQFDDNGFGASHKKIHNVFGLEMAHATFDATHKYSEKRHLILTRAGFAGTQRYCAVWTGDNESNEDHLELACLMPQSMGLCGLSFVGSDVGGFDGCPSPELFVRWSQLGAFTPFFRAHSCTGMPDKEPWAFGEEALQHIREAILLRYRFLPYLYTAFYECSQSGLPIMRPMVLDYQDDPMSLKAQLQFMVGENLLAAPVLSEKERTKKLYLPEGRWLSWWDNRIYSGKQWIVVDAPLSQIPLFIREGGIIPLWEAQQFVGEKKIETLELVIFPSAKSSYELYEDDGISYNNKNGVYSITNINVEKGTQKTSIHFSKPHAHYDSPISRYIIKLHDVTDPIDVSADKRKLERFREDDTISHKVDGFSYDRDRKILTIAIMLDKKELQGEGIDITAK